MCKILPFNQCTVTVTLNSKTTASPRLQYNCRWRQVSALLFLFIPGGTRGGRSEVLTNKRKLAELCMRT